MKIKNDYIRISIIAVVTALVVLGLYFSFPALISLSGYLVSLFLPFIIGYFYTLAVRPLMSLFTRKLKLPSWISAVLVMIVSIGVIGGIASLVITKVFEQVRNIYTQFPIIYQNGLNTFNNTKTQLLGLYEMLPQNIQMSIQAFGTNFTSKIAEFINTQSLPMISYAGATARALPKVFVGLIVFFLASFFMLSEPDTFTNMFKAHIPDGIKKKWANVKFQLKSYLGGYIKAQCIIMLVAFCILFLGLSILGVEFSLIIAIGIAVLDALPFFGSGAVLWPWALINFINGDLKGGIAMLVIYVVIVMTRQFIEPKIVSKKIGTNPLLTLMSMYIGYKTFSIGGMILGPVILLCSISFYKAGVFDGIIAFFKYIVHIIKNEYNLIKNKFKELGE